MEHRIDVKEWVRDYVLSLYKSKGYDPANVAVAKIIEDSRNDWRRFMVKSGLNADQFLADEVAFEFRCKKLIGGAGHLFENFADFVNSRPRAVREVEFQQQTTQVECDICCGKGYEYVEGVSRTGEVKETPFRCTCFHGTKYASLNPMTPAMQNWVLQNRQAQSMTAERWCRDRGIETSSRSKFFPTWRNWLYQQGDLDFRIEKGVKGETRPERREVPTVVC